MKPGPGVYMILRRCAQLLTVLAFCVLPWLNIRDAQYAAPVKGSLFALDLWGLPFADPVAALQVASGGFTPAGRLLLGALLSLVLALFLGRVFCSWICPYGLFSELIHALRQGKGEGTAGNGRLTTRPARAFACKSGIVLLGLICAAVLSFPLLSQMSMPGELSLTPLLIWQGASATFLLSALVVPVAALLLEAASGKRLWCAFICPQSVLLGLAARCLPAKAPGLRIAWRASRCTCKAEIPCRAACSLALNPRQTGGPPRRDCTMCGDCLKACAGRGGALAWRLRPVREERPPCAGLADVFRGGTGSGG